MNVFVACVLAFWLGGVCGIVGLSMLQAAADEPPATTGRPAAAPAPFIDAGLADIGWAHLRPLPRGWKWVAVPLVEGCLECDDAVCEQCAPKGIPIGA